MADENKIAGIVRAIEGEGQAFLSGQTSKSLEIGDKVYLGDEIITNGRVAVSVELANNTTVDVGGDTTLEIDTFMISEEEIEEGGFDAPVVEDTPQTAEELLAFLENQDATAAGPASGGGEGNEGSSFVILDRSTDATTPESGFDTDGLTDAVSTLAQEELIVIDDDEPIVPVVSVEFEPEVPDLETELTGALEGGPEDTNVLRFVVTLDQPTTVPVSVDVNTVDGTAIGGEDYIPFSDTITFEPGETEQVVEVIIIGDFDVELDESVILELSNPIGVTLNPDASSVAADIINDDYPTIIDYAITDQLEGAVGESNQLSVEFFLDTPALEDFDITYTLGEGDDGEGFSPASQNDVVQQFGTYTITVPAGSDSFIIPIDTIGDGVVENNESVGVTLIDGTNINLGSIDGTKLNPVIENDDVPYITIGSTNSLEGDPSENPDQENNSLVWNFTLDQPSNKPVIIDYTINDGLDVFSVIVPAGQTSVDVFFDITPDFTVEPDETVTLNVVNTENAELDADQSPNVDAIILNDDYPFISVEGSEVLEGNVGDSNQLEWTLNFDQTPLEDITVTYQISSQDAGMDVDWISPPNGNEQGVYTVTIPAGSTDYTVIVPIIGDLTVEQHESVQLEILDATNAEFQSANPVSAIILNDDVPVLTITPYDSVEGDGELQYVNGPISDFVESNNTLQWEMNLDVLPTTTEPVSVTFTIGGQTDGEENTQFAESNDWSNVYTDQSDPVGSSIAPNFDGSFTIIFEPNQQSANVFVDIVGDLTVEYDETLRLEVQSVQNVIYEPENEDAVILNDDSVEFYINDAEGVDEGSAATFQVGYIGDIEEGVSVSVDVNTADGTALAGSDYTETNETFTFNGGESTVQSFVVDTIDDDLVEGNENFLAEISSDDENAIVGSNDTGEAIIYDGEGRGSDSLGVGISVLPVDYITEGDVQNVITYLLEFNGDALGDEYTMTFDVIVAAEQGIDATVPDDYTPAVLDSLGSVLSGINGISLSGNTVTVTSDFVVGNIPFTLNVVNDDILERTESIEVSLTQPIHSNNGSVFLTKQSAEIDILDDDFPELIVEPSDNVLEGTEYEDIGRNALEWNLSLSASLAVLDAPLNEAKVYFDIVAVTGEANDIDLTGLQSDLNGYFVILNESNNYSATVSVPIDPDSAPEFTDSFKLVVTDTGDEHWSYDFDNQSAPISILNDDVSKLSIKEASIEEGSALAPNTLIWTLMLSQAVEADTIIDYHIENGSTDGLADWNYTGIGSVTILAGQTSANVEVNLVGDDIVEDDETLYLVVDSVSTTADPLDLNNQQVLFLQSPSIKGTIVNDDSVEFYIRKAVGDEGSSEVTEGDIATFIVGYTGTLAPDVNAQVTVTTVDSTAEAGSDFTYKQQVFTFVSTGSNEQQFTVSTINDELAELTEEFVAELSAPTDNGTISATEGSAIGTILDDDPVILEHCLYMPNSHFGQISTGINPTGNGNGNLVLKMFLPELQDVDLDPTIPFITVTRVPDVPNWQMVDIIDGPNGVSQQLKVGDLISLEQYNRLYIDGQNNNGDTTDPNELAFEFTYVNANRQTVNGSIDITQYQSSIPNQGVDGPIFDNGFYVNPIVEACDDGATIHGSVYADTLIGGAGDDVIISGANIFGLSDQIDISSGGNDSIYYYSTSVPETPSHPYTGHDIVNGFEDDVIDEKDVLIFQNANDIISVSESFGDTQILFGRGESVVLVGVTKTDNEEILDPFSTYDSVGDLIDAGILISETPLIIS